MRQGTLIARELLKQGIWRCPTCKEMKNLEGGFYRNKASRTGYSSHCVICMNEAGRSADGKAFKKKYYRRDKLIVRDRMLRTKFGISLDEYNRKLTDQNGICAICSGVNSDRSLAVDHNHKTGQVRGLLCSRCNAAIGFLQEDTDRALKAIDYIRRYDGLHKNSESI